MPREPLPGVVNSPLLGGCLTGGRQARAEKLIHELRLRGEDPPQYDGGKKKISSKKRARKEETYINLLNRKLSSRPPSSGCRREKRLRSVAAEEAFLREAHSEQLAARVVFVSPGTVAGANGVTLSDGTYVAYKKRRGYSYLVPESLVETQRLAPDAQGLDVQVVEARLPPRSRFDEGELILRVIFRRLGRRSACAERRSAHLMCAPHTPTPVHAASSHVISSFPQI